MTVATGRTWWAGPQADLSRLPVSLDLRAINLAEGVRAALAVAVIGVLDEWLHIPGLAEAALGALLTCLCDSGGPIRRRIPALLAFAAGGTLLTAGFGLLRPFGLAAVVPLATAIILVAAFARVWGPVAMQVGNLTVVVTVLSLDRVEDPRTALILGGLFAGGSFWAVLLTMAIWRIHPYRPARRTVAEVFCRLGTMVGDLVPLLRDENPAQWEQHARAHRRHVRDGIEAARTLVNDTVRIRGGGTTRASQTVIQLEASDQLFGALIALSDVLESADAETRDAAAQALPALRLLLARVADATAQDHATNEPAVAPMTQRLLGAFAMLRSKPLLAGVVDAIISRLQIALLLTTPEGLIPGGNGIGETPAERRGRLLAPVRANLAWSSPILRHAARAALFAAPALVLTLSLGGSYAHWFTITLVLTLQPFFATTWQRAVERGAGTVIGGVAAAGIAAIVHGPLATALVIAPLAITAFAVRGVSFGIFMACLTPMVVLLSELGRPGESEVMIAAYRAGYTLLGGALALAGGLLVWPSWEGERVRSALASAIAAHAAYADLELAALLDRGATMPAALENVRRAAGLASNNLEAALSRALQEPRSEARAEAETALVVDAALRRLAGRLLALQHDPAQAGSDRTLLAAWRAWLTDAFAAVAAAQPLPAQPPERDHPALGRMARQMALIAGAMSGNKA